MRRLVVFLVACGGGSAGGGDGDDDDDVVDTETGSDPPLEPSSTLLLEPAANFAYVAAYDGPHASIAQADFTIDWSGLTRDMLGRPLDPASVALVEMQARSEPLARVLDAIAAGGPPGADALDLWYGTPAGGNSLRATELSRQGFPFDPAYWMVPGTVATFVILLQDDGSKTLSVATASVDGGADRVVFDDSAALDWSATLSADVLATAADLGPWTIDWSGLTEDALGNPVDPLDLEELFLGHFADGADLGAVLLDPQASADGWYQKYIAGKTSVLAEEISAIDGSGPFAGFTADGLWLLGVRCSDCTTRIPLFAAEVRVVP